MVKLYTAAVIAVLFCGQWGCSSRNDSETQTLRYQIGMPMDSRVLVIRVLDEPSADAFGVLRGVYWIENSVTGQLEEKTNCCEIECFSQSAACVFHHNNIIIYFNLKDELGYMYVLDQSNASALLNRYLLQRRP